MIAPRKLALAILAVLAGVVLCSAVADCDTHNGEHCVSTGFYTTMHWAGNAALPVTSSYCNGWAPGNPATVSP